MGGLADLFFWFSYKDFHQKYDMTGLAVVCFIFNFKLKTQWKTNTKWCPWVALATWKFFLQSPCRADWLRQPPESNKLSPDLFVDDPFNKLYVNFQFWRPGCPKPQSNKLSPDFFVDDPLNKLYVNFQIWRPGCPWAHLGSSGLSWSHLGSSGLTWALFLTFV